MPRHHPSGDRGTERVMVGDLALLAGPMAGALTERDDDTCDEDQRDPIESPTPRCIHLARQPRQTHPRGARCQQRCSRTRPPSSREASGSPPATQTPSPRWVSWRESIDLKCVVDKKNSPKPAHHREARQARALAETALTAEPAEISSDHRHHRTPDTAERGECGGERVPRGRCL